MHIASTSSKMPPIGNAQLDDDHDEFLGLSQALCEAEGPSLLHAFDALHAHARAHFSFEDALMSPYEFASKECHVDEHAAVLKSFEEVRAAVVEGRIQIARRFAEHLIAWLPEHVDALDRHLAKFIFFRQTGGAPVLLHR